MHSEWMRQAREHWKEHRPKMFAELRKSGKLGQALKRAVDQTHREMNQLENQGYRHHEAWEIVREKYLFPPEEPGLDEMKPHEWGIAARMMPELTALHSDIMRADEEAER